MIRVLLVDDHIMFREGLKQILGKHSDMKVVGEAGNAADALTMVRATQADVVLLDITLPGPSGLDVLNAVMAEMPDQQILILSMHPEDQYAVRMLKAGAAGYITKERAAEDLVTAVRKVASGGRYVSAELGERLAADLQKPATRPPHELLSDREFEVFRMLASGKTLKEIAEALALSEKTITTYRARVLEKLQLRNNVELTHYAIKNNLTGM
jgi:two-component system, NarL family, invasion response regulator UvrY